MADTQISRIQVRRGRFEDLPILNEGELGYALDRKRLFIGNANDEFIGDGNTNVFVLSYPVARPQGQLLVYVDDTRKTPDHDGPLGPLVGDYTVSGNVLTFTNGNTPSNGAVIHVGFNSEMVVKNTELPMDMFQLGATQTDQTTGFFFNKTLFNTAMFDYSIKDASGNMVVGNLRLITDGVTVQVFDSFTQTASLGITFSGSISGDNVVLKYSNTSSATAKFYYSVKLWNTIG